MNKANTATDESVEKSVPESAVQTDVATATAVEVVPTSAPDSAPATASPEPTDEVALQDFLAKNFLYENSSDDAIAAVEPLRITIPDQLPVSGDEPRAIRGEVAAEVQAVAPEAQADSRDNSTFRSGFVTPPAGRTGTSPETFREAPHYSKEFTAKEETPQKEVVPLAKEVDTKKESAPARVVPLKRALPPEPEPKLQSAEIVKVTTEDVALVVAKTEPTTEENAGAEEEIISAAAAIPVEAETPLPKPSDWAFEEKLASHKEWVDSQGVTGKRADLSCAQLEEAELIGLNLRYADLHAANLKAADMLLTDLRDACLVRANLQESCLVGANLEGANLEGASMETAMGLVPRQLAGATLRDAALPGQIRQFSALSEFERASQTAKRYFTAGFTVSAISWLMIWKTKDAQLLTDSAIIPYLHSAASAAALPTDQIYLIAPVAVFILYLLFQYHLQRLWDAVLELPAVFPDGQTLGEKAPRIVTGLLRAHFRWMNQDAPSTRVIERVVAALLAYWIAPVTLVLYWARYLTLQDFHGTLLQDSLATIAIGVAVYATTKVGRPQERWIVDGKGAGWLIAKLRAVSPISLAILAFVTLTLLSAGTIKGVPHDRGRAPQFSMADIRRWAPTVFWSVGFNPFADLTEASIATRPDNWTGADDQVASVKGAYLNNRHVRYAQAYGVFLANSHLWQADFQGSFMSESDLRNADLGQSNLRYVTLDRAQMSHANMDRAVLDGANLTRVDMREANLSYSSAVGAVLVDARLDGASLYSARLDSATMIRTSLEKADLRNAYLGNANLSHADMQQAYLWSAQLPGAHMEGARLGSAIFIEANLSKSDLHGAEMPGTVLNGADLTGTNLDGADMRGALGLTVGQVCSAASRRGVMLDETIQPLVDAQCGGLH